MLELDYRLGGKVRCSAMMGRGDSLMLVPDETRKCVVFLCYQSPDGLLLAGTAFFVSVPMEGFEHHFVYVVTARHVIEGMKDKSTDQKVYLRVNLKDEGTQLVPTPIEHWVFHPEDPSVDAAVLWWAPPPAAQVDFLTLPSSTMTVTDEIIAKRGIGAGDEVFVTGLFVNHFGTQRNLPIVRIGNIALMPEEPVLTREFGLIDAYLIEVRSIGGLSGSPAFVHLAGVRLIDGKSQMQPSAFYWLDLVHGHWDVDVPGTNTFAADWFREERVNMGIAIVVPASKIMEVINRPEFIERRKRIEEEIRMRRAPTPDDGRAELADDVSALSHNRP